MAFENPNPSMDPFAGFWQDMMAKMNPTGMGQPFAPNSEDASKQMRRVFFDFWATQCEEYMRSEQFLDAMKQSMENAMAFKQQTNDFLSRVLKDTPMPTKTDTDSLMLVLRSFEEKVLTRLESISRRVDALENVAKAESSKAMPAKRRTKGDTQ